VAYQGAEKAMHLECQLGMLHLVVVRPVWQQLIE